MYKLTNGWPIRMEDGAFVNPETNAAYLVWLSEGNTPDPYIPPPPAIPSVISMRQARLALLKTGKLKAVNAAISQAGEAAQIEWEFAIEVHRSWPLVAALQSGLGLTDDDLDALFVLGATL